MHLEPQMGRWSCSRSIGVRRRISDDSFHWRISGSLEVQWVEESKPLKALMGSDSTKFQSDSEKWTQAPVNVWLWK